MANPVRWTTTGKWSPADTFALQALQPLEGPYLPWTGFALRPSAAMTVVNEIALYEAKSIVEFGSGLSTVLFARFLRQRGDGGRIVSVDDNADWAAQIGRYLEREDLSEYVELVTATPERWSPPGAAEDDDDAGWAFPLPKRWYALEPIRRAIGDAEVDFMLVDGPRGKRSIARYPALVSLESHLAADCTVVLDDANRPGEKEIVSRWAAVTNFQFVDYGRYNLAVGRRA